MRNHSIDILKAILLALVVLIHCNLNHFASLPLPASAIIRFVSQNLCSVAVPGFFLISGYLFFINIRCFDAQTYRKKILSRVKTLLIPYLLWNLIAAATDIVKGFAFGIPTPGFVENGTVCWEGMLTGFWSIVDGRPLAFAFWFIRNLMVFVLLTPLIWTVVRRRLLFYAVLVVMLATGWGWGAVYFMTGAYIAVSGMRVPVLAHRGASCMLALYLGLATLGFCMPGPALPWVADTLLVWPMTLAALLALMPLCTSLGQSPSEHHTGCGLLKKLLANTFFIYAFHQLYCSVNCKLWLWLLPPGADPMLGSLLSLADYMLTFGTFILLSLGAGLLTRRFCPRAYAILTGGRTGDTGHRGKQFGVLAVAAMLGMYAPECGAKVPKALKETLGYGLPVLVIETDDGVLPTVEGADPPPGSIGHGAINATKVPGRVDRYEPDGTVTYSSGEYIKKMSGMTLKIRGNSTALEEKKPYKVKLQRSADMLVRGPGHADTNWALIKDEGWKQWMGHTIARTVETQWHPAMEPVNVILNGEYHGLYLLIETIEPNSEARVDVGPGGFLVERDPYWWTEEGEYIESPYHPVYNWTFKLPEFEDLTEADIMNVTGSLHPLWELYRKGGYGEKTDVDSFADYLIVHDLMCNEDGGGANLYFTKYDSDPDTPVRVGPAWDFDWTSLNVAEGWRGPHNTHPFSALWSSPDPAFREAYKRRWLEVRAQVAMAIIGEIPYGPCSASAWDKSRVANNALYSVKASSHSALAEVFQRQLAARYRWMDKEILNLDTSWGDVPDDPDDPDNPSGVDSATGVTGVSWTPTPAGFEVRGLHPGDTAVAVSLHGCVCASATADADGRVELQLREPGVYILTAPSLRAKALWH